MLFRSDLDKEFRLLPKLGVNKGEIEEAKIVVMNNNPDDGVQGSNTLWKLAQSVSAVARNKGELRQRELEEISGQLLSRVV